MPEDADRPWTPKRIDILPLDGTRPIDQQTEILEQLARKLVGESYRRDEEQIKAMVSFATGKDVLLMMPTGGGKSLCYQVPTLASNHGLTVVFSPLRALIQNQIDDLENAGIPVSDMVGYLLGARRSGCKNPPRVRQLAEDGILKLLYLTPEMAGLDFTLFPKLNVHRIVLDEAHCLVTWGTTFRPDYLRLAQRIRNWREHAGESVTIMACSATLTQEYEAALRQQLGLNNPVVIRGNVDRPNLYWGVDILDSAWGLRDCRLQEVLARLPHYAQAIVYTTYARTSDQVALGLIKHGFRAAAYHAKL